jgi:hypothetical protein
VTSFPTSLPSSPANYQEADFRLEPLTSISMSPMTRSTQAIERDAAMWVGEFTLPPLTRAQMREWRAKLNSMKGQFGSFRQGDPFYSGPAGTAGGTPLVKGGSQVGTTLLTDGWSAGATFLTGDLFQLGDYLYEANADATADGSGNMTLTFEPPLRSSPSDNAPLTITSPKTIMKLRGYTCTGTSDGFFHITLSAYEAL